MGPAEACRPRGPPRQATPREAPGRGPGWTRRTPSAPRAGLGARPPARPAESVRPGPWPPARSASPGPPPAPAPQA
eukprot:14671281-Heterocapsa_arctica.AAC.1